MVMIEFGASEKRWKRNWEENQGKFQEGNKIKKEVQKGKVSSSLEIVTEPERNDVAAVSEAAVEGVRVSHAGAAQGKDEDGRL